MIIEAKFGDDPFFHDISLLLKSKSVNDNNNSNTKIILLLSRDKMLQTKYLWICMFPWKKDFSITHKVSSVLKFDMVSCVNLQS